jgi:hypothetical protein
LTKKADQSVIYLGSNLSIIFEQNFIMLPILKLYNDSVHIQSLIITGSVEVVQWIIGCFNYCFFSLSSTALPLHCHKLTLTGATEKIGL